MKKRNLLLFSILVLIIGSFILPSFVSAERTYYSPLADSVEEEGSWDAPLMLGPWNPVYDLFTSWSEGEVSIQVAKFVFLLLLFVIIFGVSSALPFIGEKASLKAIFSILVAFLATAYLTPEEVFVLITSYSAMGIVLGSIIPFLILFFFTWKAAEKGGPAVFLQWFTWLSFSTWMVYKLIILIWFQGARPEYVGNSILWVHGILTLIGVAMLVWNRQIRGLIVKEERKETKVQIFKDVEDAGVVDAAKKKQYNIMKKNALRKK